MTGNLAALLYLVAGVLFILALRGLSSPESSRRGNYFGIAGMVIAVVTTLFLAAPGLRRDHPDRRRHRHRRRHRRLHRAAHPDDGDAAARRRLPFAGRPRRGPRRRRLPSMRPMLSASASRAPSTASSLVEMSIGVRDRRDHLHRLGHRVPEARRPHVRRADPPTLPPLHQCRPRHPSRRARSLSSSSARARSSSG